MTPQSAFWELAAASAMDVPAEGAERASWITRNLAEVALMLEVADGPIQILDEMVRSLELGAADYRHVTRLRGLRSRRGRVPTWYPSGSTPAVPPPASDGDREAARALLDFAAALDDGVSVRPGPQTTSSRGAAPSVHRRRRWRPTRYSAVEPVFVEVGVPSSLLWRPWMTLPKLGVVRVVGDESVQGRDADVWWGVHDGTHLDHLACFDTTRTTPVEFGAGLLVTEALAMCAELLAGAEALISGDRDTQAVVRAGLVERVERQPLATTGVASTGVTEGAAEFRALPGLARAYVSGPLALMAQSFHNPLVREEVSASFSRRWDHVGAVNPAVRQLIERAGDWWSRHGK